MCCIVLVFDVLVASRVHDVRDNHSADVMVQNKRPHAEDCNSKTVCYEKNRFVFETVADVDGCDDEAGVGEHHGPPTEMEVLRSRVHNLWRRLVLNIEQVEETCTYSNESNY